MLGWSRILDSSTAIGLILIEMMGGILSMKVSGGDFLSGANDWIGGGGIMVVILIEAIAALWGSPPFQLKIGART